MPLFTKLNVWKSAYELSLEVYRVSAAFPPREVYGLTSQLRRAATSVGANIAEGQRRKTSRDFANFITIAEGSLAETQHFLMLSLDLKYLSPEAYTVLEAKSIEVEKMLVALQRSLQPKRSE